MRTFKDNAGRTWSVAVDCDAIRRVRSALQFVMTSADFLSVVERLTKDPVLLCDVLYVICKPESDVKNVSETDFFRAMFGDAIEHGLIALLEEIVNFTPNPRDRARVQKTLENMMQMARDGHDKMDRKVQEIFDRLRAQSGTISGPSSGASPGTSVSIPAP